NRASMAISRTMGTASRKMARSTDTAGENPFGPKTASFIRARRLSRSLRGGSGAIGCVGGFSDEIKTVLHFNFRGWVATSQRAYRDLSGRATCLEKRIG